MSATWIISISALQRASTCWLLKICCAQIKFSFTTRKQGDRIAWFLILLRKQSFVVICWNSQLVFWYLIYNWFASTLEVSLEPRVCFIWFFASICVLFWQLSKDMVEISQRQISKNRFFSLYLQWLPTCRYVDTLVDMFVIVCVCFLFCRQYPGRHHRQHRRDCHCH